jgi:hypothetical protein
MLDLERLNCATPPCGIHGDDIEVAIRSEDYKAFEKSVVRSSRGSPKNFRAVQLERLVGSERQTWPCDDRPANRARDGGRDARLDAHSVVRRVVNVDSSEVSAERHRVQWWASLHGPLSADEFDRVLERNILGSARCGQKAKDK